VALWGWSTRQERIAWQRIARGYEADRPSSRVPNESRALQQLSRPPRWLSDLHERSALVRLVVNAKSARDRTSGAALRGARRAASEGALDGFSMRYGAAAEVERDGARSR